MFVTIYGIEKLKKKTCFSQTLKVKTCFSQTLKVKTCFQAKSCS